MGSQYTDEQWLNFGTGTPGFNQSFGPSISSPDVSGKGSQYTDEQWLNFGRSAPDLSQLSGAFSTDGTGAASGNGTPEFNSAMDAFKSSIEDIKYIGSMAELTGGLSAQETQMLETIRSNATTNLTNAVNESTVDLAQTEISRLVDRGVLQGDIGANIISQVYENAGDTVGAESRNIESDVARMGLDIIDKNKQYQMDMWGKQYDVTRDKAAAYGQAAGLQMDWDKSQASNALTRELGQMELGAYESAQDKQMWGNLGSAALTASPYLIPALGKGMSAVGSALGLTGGAEAAGTAAAGTAAAGAGAGAAGAAGVGAGTVGGYADVAGLAAAEAGAGGAATGGATTSGLAGMGGLGALGPVMGGALAVPLLGPKLTEWGGDFFRDVFSGGGPQAPGATQNVLAFEQGLSEVPGWSGHTIPSLSDNPYENYNVWSSHLDTAVFGQRLATEGEDKQPHISYEDVQAWLNKEITLEKLKAKYNR